VFTTPITSIGNHEQQAKEMTMRRVIFNQKGGVGKSTITCNLATLSAVSGRRTLLVDLDPQANASQYLLGNAVDSIELTLVDYYQETLSFNLFPKKTNEYVHSTPIPNLDILASHEDLGELMYRLESRYKIGKIKDALDSLDDYEAVYIDTPPAFNFYTLSALIAANRCLIPFDCDDFSRRALYRLLEHVQEIQQDHNRSLEVEGIVVNQFQQRANLPNALVSALLEEGLPILEAYLSHTVKIRESHQCAVPLVLLAPKHKVSQQFYALFKELNANSKASDAPVSIELR
jgi:chromosome partitioning protein